MIHMVQIWDNLDYEVVLLLIKGERHLRDISKALDASHSTVMRRLNVLATENVLDYRTEGKNKVFSIKKNLEGRNYVYNAEIYKLNKVIKKYPALAVIMEGILKKTDERLIILFGSYAKFSAKEDSDIDVYIESNGKKAKDAAESVNSMIRVKTGDFNPESLLIKEIIKNHVIVRGVEDFYEKTGFFN
jgi:predicted nucleotidyltransferase